jgi:hypothetical protein
MKNLVLATLIGLSAQTTFALGIGLDLGLNLGLGLGQIATGGNGCPNGSVTVRESDRGLTLYYSNDMTAGQDWEKRIERISCNVRLPINVPAGLRLVTESRTQGFAWVEGDEVKVREELFLVGSRGEVVERKLSTGDFTLEAPEHGHLRSGCGQDVILAANLSATVLKKSGSLTDSFVAVDKTVIKIKFERCD